MVQVQYFTVLPAVHSNALSASLQALTVVSFYFSLFFFFWCVVKPDCVVYMLFP